MPQRIFAVLAICFMCFFSSAHAAAPEDTPDQFVRDFYAWYLECFFTGEGFKGNSAIHKLVDAKLVEFIEKDTLIVDYFTQSAHDFPKETKVITGKLIHMHDKAVAVPVTFKLGYTDRHVIVFVKRHEGSFRIFKVCDIYPYM